MSEYTIKTARWIACFQLLRLQSKPLMTDLPYWQTTRLTSLTNQKTYFTDKPQDWPHWQTTRLTSLTNHKTYLTDKPQELPYWQTTRLTSLTNHKTDLTDKPQDWPHWQTTRLTLLTNHARREIFWLWRTKKMAMEWQEMSTQRKMAQQHISQMS